MPVFLSAVAAILRGFRVGFMVDLGEVKLDECNQLGVLNSKNTKMIAT